VWLSDGNFILIELKQAADLLAYLSTKKILVRGFPNMPTLKFSLRITIGSIDDNEKLINALNEFRGN
jgi:histidinol-phosphate aminotransferase